MPDIETLVIAGVAWTSLSVLALALCHAAAGADRAPGRPHPKGVPQARPSTPPVVADVGGLRAQLRAAAGLLETAQLSVSIEAHYEWMEASLGKDKLGQLYGLLDELISLEQP